VATAHTARNVLEQLGLTGDPRATSLVVEMLTALGEGHEQWVPELSAPGPGRGSVR
jgi:hypothetical protein